MPEKLTHGTIRVWECKLVIPAEPRPAHPHFDTPLKVGVEEIVRRHGVEVLCSFTGWGGQLSNVELAVLNDDDDAAIEAAEQKYRLPALIDKLVVAVEASRDIPVDEPVGNAVLVTEEFADIARQIADVTKGD